jgi:hypothetical protein
MRRAAIRSTAGTPLSQNFVQVAEIDVLGKDYFDKIIIAATEKSYNANFGARTPAAQPGGAKYTAADHRRRSVP